MTHAHLTTVDLATLPADEVEFLQDYRALSPSKRVRFMAQLLFWFVTKNCNHCPSARPVGKVEGAVGAEDVELLIR